MSEETPTDRRVSAFAQGISDAYAAVEPALPLGTLLDGSVPVPGVTAAMPFGMFNRHLLVAGATGTGKTRTLQLMAEGLSSAGVPVLLCDVKGDLTGLAEPGTASQGLHSRVASTGQQWQPAAFPVELLSVGEPATPLTTNTDAFTDTPVRVPISDFGPLLLSRALELNTTQEQALQLIFAWADKHGLELVDLADIRAVITYLVSPDGKEDLQGLGGVSSASAGVILRALTVVETQGGDVFFGAPGFDTADLLRLVDGKGVISLLQVGDLTQRPSLVSAVIMWLLADLFSGLPEVGDPEKPTLVFFFDEAHLLFADATKEFLRQVIQTVRLIRSKGVGIVFVTQTPKDIPSDVLAQLGSRIQHALRVATPDDQKKLKQTVATFPATELDLAEILTGLGTGEAVISVLAPDGRPTPVAPFRLWAPASVMGPAAPETLARITAASPLLHTYATAYNPESAEEKLAASASEKEQRKKEEAAEQAAQKAAEKAQATALIEHEREKRAAQKAAQKETERRNKAINSLLTSVLRSASSQLGREITRSIFGTRRR